MTMQVQAVIQAPSELEHQFSKRNLRKKEVFLRGVLWETATHICDDHVCGAIVDKFGNYVTRLEDEVQELRAKLAAFETREKT